MKTPVYLDYMATTPIDPRVIESMLTAMGPTGNYGNPSSVQHAFGQRAACAVNVAREQIANAVGATAPDIIFTSGATEANNLALLGGANFYQRSGKHIITLTTEHKAVLDTMDHLSKTGFEITYLNPCTNGLLDIDTLSAALRPDTILVSVMHVNNEIGVIQDIAAIGDLLRGKGIIFHVDAAQSAGKIPINLSQLSVDLMSFSAHKNYGPKGIGALYVRHKPRIRLQAQSWGGGQENGLRAGTLPTHQIIGRGLAFFLSESERNTEQVYLRTLANKLWNGIRDLPGIVLHGHPTQRVAGNLNFSLPGIDGADLLPAIMDNIAVSSQSACASASGQPSYVLRALGVDAPRARSAIRLSVGRFTTDEDIQYAIGVLCSTLSRLQNISR